MTHKKYIGPNWTRPVKPPFDYKPGIEKPAVQKMAKAIDDAVIAEIIKQHSVPITTEAVKADAGKADWSLMPFEAVEEINKVLEFGAKKYAAHNWKLGGGFKYSRLLNSLLRHIFAYMRGEDIDPESGLNHLAHAGCNIVFLLYYTKYKDKFANDDRIK